jgi:6-phosphogluconolactonase/glucosamine-6-phosphate isomerase/deaminase
MAVTFSKVTSKQAETQLLTALKEALAKQNRVLWIVSGGSSIPLAVSTMSGISEADSAKLAIMLSDERFGPIGHPDSNLQQLYKAGFEPKQATVVPVLRPGSPLAQTTELYGHAVETAFAAADYIVAQLGIGPDGHIAGILPGSLAIKPTKKWAVAYETPEYTRITMTPFALQQVSAVFAPVFGSAKKIPLENLRDKQLPISKQPAQLLKKIDNVTILNDQIGASS